VFDATHRLRPAAETANRAAEGVEQVSVAAISPGTRVIFPDDFLSKKAFNGTP
jgi:hypothetical protein